MDSSNLLMVIALILFAIAHIADVLTTRRALKVPGLYESNPIIAYLMEHFGESGWIWIKFLIAIAIGWIFYDQDMPLMLFGFAALTGYISYRNYKYIKKRRTR